MGSYLLTLCFCNFRGKEYYLISLRSVQIRIFCLWLKYAFFVNSKHYSRSNGTKGNFKPWKYLPLNSVLQALLSVTCFFRRTCQIVAQSQEVHLIEYRSRKCIQFLEKSQQANNIKGHVNPKIHVFLILC